VAGTTTATEDYFGVDWGGPDHTDKENEMPVITWEGGKLSAEQKKELIATLTKAAADVTKAPLQFHTVLIRELPDENLGVAGETVADLKARMANGKAQ
jgi:4-oxalocrotonate tautomerase